MVEFTSGLKREKQKVKFTIYFWMYFLMVKFTMRWKLETDGKVYLLTTLEPGNFWKFFQKKTAQKQPLKFVQFASIQIQ